MLIQWRNESGNTRTERILWLDRNYTVAFVIDIFTKTGFPEERRIYDIEEAISEGCAYQLDHDPFGYSVLEENLTKKEKEIRDKAWNIISLLVSQEQEPSIYYKHIRGPLVKKTVEQYNLGKEKGNRHEKNNDRIGEKSVYAYLRRFWQRGKTKNALLPDYNQSGGKGKTKTAGEKKRGRPRKYAGDPKIGVGINIDDGDRKIFRTSIDQFYNNKKKNPLKVAYKLMKGKYYVEDVYYDENGVEKKRLIPPGERPTFVQFRYWYEQEFNIEKTYKSRKGKIAYELENRALLGSSTAEVIGPGYQFQIDATVADVYLVSRYNSNWIVGRPVIYVIIDVFSRMIVGVYVGLEGPSWLGAMMALINAATDKVAFCKEYGIDIPQEEWPCCQLPYLLHGDNGELIGTAPETLANNLHVELSNAAPYRADWKGIVESQFRIIHQYVKPFVPGYVDPEMKRRGGKDYRLDAKLNVDQFTKIIIECIRRHNRHAMWETYVREEAMIADDIPPVPIRLWSWGIEKRSGCLKFFPEDIVKLNLLPTGKARITAKGIMFKGKRYICEKAIRERWLEKARSNKLKKNEKYLDISYDLRTSNYIYIRDIDGRGFEKCYLLNIETKYIGASVEEVDYLHAQEKLDLQRSEPDELLDDVSLADTIETIVAEADEKADACRDETLSNSQRLSGIRDNRSFEKDELRKEQAFELGKLEASNVGEKVPEQLESSENQKLERPNYSKLLRQKKQEVKDGKPV